MENKKVKQESCEKVLPGVKLSMEKQIDLLRAFAIYFEKHKKGASYKEIASIADASPTNVSESLKFWKSVGILESEGAASKPSNELILAVNKIEFNDSDGGWKIIRNKLKESWFVEHLLMTFRLTSNMTEKGLFDSLGQAYGSPNKSDSAKSIRNLIQLLETSKVILRDDKGNFTINPDIKSAGIVEPIIVNEAKDIMQIKIEENLYAIDKGELKAFILNNGKKLDDKAYDIG